MDFDELIEREKKERREFIERVPLDTRKMFRQIKRKILWERQYSGLVIGCWGGKNAEELMEEELDILFGEDSR